MKTLTTQNGVEKTQAAAETRGTVYCPICTHTVDAVIVATRKGPISKPGQKCSRCHASLDAGFVFHWTKVA